MLGGVRGTADRAELAALELEAAGLASMRAELAASLLALRARRAARRRGRTPLGRLLAAGSRLFALYCAYRVGATALAALRRRLAAPASAADPVTSALALLARHWDPALDRAAWSRQMSFLLSGAMLLASFNSALQTFLLVGRAFPGLLRHARANLALLVGQVCGTYVISSALLLRGSLPSEVGGVVSEALGAPPDAGFVEGWFDGWFLAASVATAVGIWVGRKVRGSEWDDDDDGDGEGDVESGKRS